MMEFSVEIELEDGIVEVPYGYGTWSGLVREILLNEINGVAMVVVEQVR